MSGIDMFRSRSIRLPSCGEQFMMQRKKEMIENELIVLQGLYHINLHGRKELLLKSNRMKIFELHCEHDENFAVGLQMASWESILVVKRMFNRPSGFFIHDWAWCDEFTGFGYTTNAFDARGDDNILYGERGIKVPHKGEVNVEWHYDKKIIVL